MRRAAALLMLAGCACPEMRSAVSAYQRAMDARERHADWAAKSFENCAEDAATALRECELTPDQRLTLASIRIRACIETDAVAAAEETILAHKAVFGSLDADQRYPGDIAGIALLKAAHHDNPDRALVEYLRAEDRVTGARARAFLDLRKVETLIAKATWHLASTPGAGSHRDAAKRALRDAIAVCDGQKAAGALADRLKRLRAEAASRLEALGK